MIENSLIDNSIVKLPEGFQDRVCSGKHGLEQTEGESLCLAIRSMPSPHTVRCHLSKGVSPDFTAFEMVPWCDRGVYLQDRPLFAADPWWHAGGYYVQEPGSMLLSRFTLLIEESVEENGIVLDLCAAPGGKSTLLRDYLPEGSLLIANEWDKKRAGVLRENLLRLGHPEVIVTQDDAEKIASSGVVCDVIVVDAPCSGEGMFRKEPQSVADWSEEHILFCQKRQKAILDDIWPALKSEGLLIYSTCTYNREENEEILHYLMKNYEVEVVTYDVGPLPKEIFDSGEGVLRALPSRAKTEGFTIFAVRKKEPGRWPLPLAHNSMRGEKPEKELAQRLALPMESLWFSSKNDAYHVSIAVRGEENKLRSAGVKVLSSGVFLGVQKGKDFVPSHSWALSTLRKSIYPSYECSIDEALKFFKRETFAIEAPVGFLLLKYKGLPIGWVKNIGGRVNNLLPKGMMLLNSSITSSESRLSDHFLLDE